MASNRDDACERKNRQSPGCASLSRSRRQAGQRRRAGEGIKLAEINAEREKKAHLKREESLLKKVLALGSGPAAACSPFAGVLCLFSGFLPQFRKHAWTVNGWWVTNIVLMDTWGTTWVSHGSVLKVVKKGISFCRYFSIKTKEV